MKKIFSFAFLFFFQFQLLEAQSDIQRIDKLMLSVYAAHQPGAAIAIRQRGRIIFTKAYGVSNLEKGIQIQKQTVFNVGSLTKQFTAMAILQLAGEGKLSLNDPMGKFFTGFSPRLGNTITLRNLLTHSSGILDHYAFADTRQMKHAVDRDVLAAIRGIDSLYFTTGTRYRYSNTAYCLLALVIEKASGMPYAEYILKHILRPLGMDHSYILDLSKPRQGAAVGYEKKADSSGFTRSDAAENIFFSTQGDGGLYTSLDDYLKWFDALQHPVRLNGDWVRAARSPQFPADEKKQLYYGFGWFVQPDAQKPAVYHTGSNGGFRAIVFSIPVEDYAVIIFSNQNGVDLEELVKEINKILRVNNNSFTKLDSLISFQAAYPIFAPCKETSLFLTSFSRSCSDSAMELN